MTRDDFEKRYSSICLDAVGTVPCQDAVNEEWDVYTQNRHDSLGLETGYGWEHDDNNYMYSIKESLDGGRGYEYGR